MKLPPRSLAPRGESGPSTSPLLVSHRVRRAGWPRLGAVLTLAGLALARPAAAQEAQAAGKGDSQGQPPASAKPLDSTSWPELRSTTELKWVGRWTEGAHDNDLLLYETLSLGNERKDVVSVRASGLLALDLDRNRDPTNPFYGVNDTYSGDLTGRLYTAHVDFNGVEGNPLRSALRRVRLGRMNLYETPVQMYVDGAAIETQPFEDFADAVVEAFVGMPSHLYESSSSGDFTVGAALRLQPWLRGLLRLDYMHITDEYEGGTEKDDLYGARLDQRLGQEVTTGGHINFLGSDARDVSAFLTWAAAESDASLTVRYTGLFSDMKKATLDLDYFTLFGGTFYAYDQIEAYAHKGFGDNVFVDGGVQVRELRDEADEGTFNHEFRRYYLTPGLTEWPWKGLLLTGTLEIWDAGEDSYETVGGDLTQRISEPWRASIGTYYQLYRYDVLADQEREDIQVSYVKTDYKLTKDLRLALGFEFENGDTDDYTRVILSMRWQR